MQRCQPSLSKTYVNWDKLKLKTADKYILNILGRCSWAIHFQHCSVSRLWSISMHSFTCAFTTAWISVMLHVTETWLLFKFLSSPPNSANLQGSQYDRKLLRWPLCSVDIINMSTIFIFDLQRYTTTSDWCGALQTVLKVFLHQIINFWLSKISKFTFNLLYQKYQFLEVKSRHLLLQVSPYLLTYTSKMVSSVVLGWLPSLYHCFAVLWCLIVWVASYLSMLPGTYVFSPPPSPAIDDVLDWKH